ncbi:MAG: hypothetical protein OXC31_11840 [Spirochaetaceae bacterium]|nr:hypothetical protein [Spirochaetaceae bacterium]
MTWQEPPRDSHVWQERTYRDGHLIHARDGDYRIDRTGMGQWQAVFEPSDHHLPLMERPDLGDAVVACRTHYAAMALINAGRGAIDPEKLYVRASASDPVPLLHHYAVGIGQDGPVIRGPFVTEESRLNAARELFEGDVSFLCALDVDGHHARIEAFGPEIEDGPEESEDDDPADGDPAAQQDGGRC